MSGAQRGRRGHRLSRSSPVAVTACRGHRLSRSPPVRQQCCRGPASGARPLLAALGGLLRDVRPPTPFPFPAARLPAGTANSPPRVRCGFVRPCWLFCVTLQRGHTVPSFSDCRASSLRVCPCHCKWPDPVLPVLSRTACEPVYTRARTLSHEPCLPCPSANPRLLSTAAGDGAPDCE